MKKTRLVFLTTLTAISAIALNLAALEKDSGPATSPKTVAKSDLNFSPGSQFNASLTYGSFTDARDGKTYKTIKIAGQTWMAENLAYKAPSGCWAYNDDESQVEKFGWLYNWAAATASCPAGWHLPSDEEWKTLTDFLGGDMVSGGKLKSAVCWDAPNADSTNSSGFSALATGSRTTDGKFMRLGENSRFWTSTASGAHEAWRRNIRFDYGQMYRRSKNQGDGYSIRCIKD